MLPLVSMAQLEGSFEATMPYSFNLDALGVNVRSYLFLTKRFHVGLEYTPFFEQTDYVVEERIEKSANVFD